MKIVKSYSLEPKLINYITQKSTEENRSESNMLENIIKTYIQVSAK